MTVRDMHYDYKQKLNKIDSQKFRNLKVPEIDWKLNEAQELFIKLIAQPRIQDQLRRQTGFEFGQRNIDDIRTLVVNQSTSRGTCIATTTYDDKSFLAPLPTDYFYRVASKAIGTKNNSNVCKNIELKTVVAEHDDEYESSPHHRSSFEWRVVNIRYIKEGIRIFTDGTFKITHLCLDYIKRPLRIQNAQDFNGGTYMLNGEALVGSQDCELPIGVHSEIVDLAVFLTSTDIMLPGHILKIKKLELNNDI